MIERIYGGTTEPFAVDTSMIDHPPKGGGFSLHATTEACAIILSKTSISEGEKNSSFVR